MKVLILFFMIFVLSGLLIISNNNLYMSEKENINVFFKLYGEWLGKIYFNSQVLTGNAIGLDWSPE